MKIPKIIAVSTPLDNESGILKKHKVLMVIEYEDGVVKTMVATLTPDNTYEVKSVA